MCENKEETKAIKIMNIYQKLVDVRKSTVEERKIGVVGHVHIFVRVLYGKPTIYPACAFSGFLSTLIKKTCLKIWMLKELKDLGYEIFYKGEKHEEVSKIATFMLEEGE